MSIFDYFDIPSEERNLPVTNSPQENSLGSKYTSIIEYTINCPVNKTYDKKKYADIMSKVIKAFPQGFPVDKDTDFYFEKCESGKLHMHGMFRCKKQFYVIDGLVSDISKYILQAIDKRLSHNFDKNYYPNFYRYRTPTICVQYTDDPLRVLHWEQYIKKTQ